MPEDARELGNRALYSAAKYGRVRVLREFRRNWSLNHTDVYTYNHHALDFVVMNEHVNVLRELRRHWYLNVEDAYPRINDLMFRQRMQKEFLCAPLNTNCHTHLGCISAQ